MAVGTHKGFVQIWDAAAGKKLSVLEGHTARVGECGAVWSTAAYEHMIRILSFTDKLSRISLLGMNTLYL